MRNVGSSIGISIVQALLTEKTQILHAGLVEHIRPDNPLLRDPAVVGGLDLHSAAGLAALDAMITQQAAMLAFINDYWLMMLVALATLPLLLLLRQPRRAAGPAVAMD